MDFLELLLHDMPDNARQLARHRLREGRAETTRYGLSDARLEELAMWGVTREEWCNAMRSVMFCQLHAKLSLKCPVITVSPQEDLQTNEHKFCIPAGKSVRPHVVEHWLGREIDVVDELVINEMAKVLPTGWSLIIQGRSNQEQAQRTITRIRS